MGTSPAFKLFDEYLPVDEYHLGRIRASAHAFVFQPEIKVRLPWHINGPYGLNIRLDSWHRFTGCQMTGRDFISAVLVLVLAACGDDQRRFEPPPDVYVTPEVVLASFGSFSDTTGVEALGRIDDAALSESGRYMAVADETSPHLKILDRASDSAWSFGAQGEGPGELRAAYSVEFLGDSSLLVLSGDHRLEHFSLQGEWRGGYGLSATDLLISSITAGCGQSIYAYGHPARYRHLDSLPWVHEIHRDSANSTRPLLWIPGTEFHFGWGGLEGFDATEDGVLLWDRAQTPHVGFWLACGGDAIRIWSRWAAEEIEIESGLETREGVGGQSLTLPDTLFAGAAARGSTKIWARRPYRPNDGELVTLVRVHRDGMCRAVGLLGEWTLHDAHSDGLLVSTHEPFPSVSVLDWTWFETKLAQVKCFR